ncbi:MAG: DUF1045 domain-containing protein [Geminicoccaceae bacterium]
MTGRVAVYFAPPEGSELEAFGRCFLGRDHVSGEKIEQPRIDGLDIDDLEGITRSARHYGFHATLKAPFMLKDGRGLDELQEVAKAFAAGRTAFDAPPLEITALSRWIAFTLSAPCREMDRLAADCVRDFEPFRAPLGETEIARHRKSGLTPRQDERLLVYGYPHIFEDFHFHMTLAGPLDGARRDHVLDILKGEAAALECAPLRVDAIALYEQPDRDSPFTRTARFPFRAA